MYTPNKQIHTTCPIRNTTGDIAHKTFEIVLLTDLLSGTHILPISWKIEQECCQHLRYSGVYIVGQEVKSQKHIP